MSGMRGGLLCLQLTFVFVLLSPLAAEQIDVLEAVENPHMAGRQGSCLKSEGAEEQETGCESCQALGPVALPFVLNEPVSTQTDTLLRIEHKVYMGAQVPVYHFKQPHRLNPGQLPFKLIRTSFIESSGVIEVPVDPKAAHDSWFPQYYWDILICNSCQGVQHLGWKFNPKDPSSGLAPFYALIVDYKENKKREAEGARDVLEGLSVGVRAPAWMIAMATTTLGIDFATQKKH
mmetsp:Transcript_32143/g.50174  ORF Transcript_32143/g.50174 Transcript_32143/m.50174 type:complete len:233 (-) Transcript_32143:215-913(-)|eukprot:CAMPEP_0184294656 /NCGR_PEP_ID=MMETSP1049-20130417/5780_1 /TAXON_ID=77928 /ORGANISM="Proteomonas sulcata, Strain CCMP704" /LENGTH=232 /DNA_ID=CAMNT_0026603017 /DNA_START=205 /DNA_END=903 /DNA_ORIENTATION=+